MATSDFETYKNLANAIIAKQVELLGRDLAIKKAQKVGGLQVDEEGSVVSILEDNIKTLGELVRKYSDVSGNTAIKFCRESIKPILEENPDIKLPKELQENFSLEENFLSAL